MLVIPANGAVGGYNLTRSLRLRSSASAYLSRTPASAGNRSVWTWSGWVKRGKLGTLQGIFGAGNTSGGGPGATYITGVTFNGSDQLFCYWGGSGAGTSTAVFRDPSAWYHLVVVANTTTLTCYMNNVSVLSNSISGSGAINDTQKTTLGSFWDTAGSAVLWVNDIYMAEVNFIDGQALTPSSFGSTNATTGVWQPAPYTGTYGTNGFYLPFTDNSALTTSSNVGLGKDFSGNGNYWTTNNISITSGVTYDSMTDVPTLTSATAANYCVVNPLDKNANITMYDGNLRAVYSSTNGSARGSIAIPASGKFYWELSTNLLTDGDNAVAWGLCSGSRSLSAVIGQSGDFATYLVSVIRQYSGASYFGTTATLPVNGSINQVVVDATNGKMWVGNNNTFYDGTGGITGNPSTGANPTFTGSFAGLFPFIFFDLTVGNINIYANFGQRPFAYTPPTGFVALNAYNLPDSTIKAGNKYMDVSLYTGNGTTQTITNGGSFQPDLVWVKARSDGTQTHKLTDSVRGVGYGLTSNNTAAEIFNSAGVTSFDAGGFSIGSQPYYNTNASTYVAWQWKAGGAAVSNTAGSITSSVTANASAGFSVVTYTGSGVASTVGHGLGVAPSMIIFKNRVNGSASWGVYHQELGASSYVLLSSPNPSGTSSALWNATSPTSSVFSVGTDATANQSTSGIVAYCFAPIAGYSAFGSYTGNGSADGTFVYTGFRPKFLMLKNADATESWNMLDSARSSSNLANALLFPNASAAETAAFGVDFLSNGFKLRSTSTQSNANGQKHIFAAFAESPFKNSLAR